MIKVFIFCLTLVMSAHAFANEKMTFLFYFKIAECPLSGACGFGLPGTSSMKPLTIELTPDPAAPDRYFKGQTTIVNGSVSLLIQAMKAIIKQGVVEYTIDLMTSDPDQKNYILSDMNSPDPDNFTYSAILGNRFIQGPTKYIPIIVIMGVNQPLTIRSRRGNLN